MIRGPAKPQAPASFPRNARKTWFAGFQWLAPALVALVTFAAFAPALSAGFVAWDDDRNFVANIHYRGLGGPQLAWMWSTFHLGHYVPLSWMTLGLDYNIWGMNPFGYHLTNILLHSVNAVLVYFVARKLLRLGVGDRAADKHPAINHETITLAAVLAALVFSVHPLRVESVAWITERRDVFSGCWLTLTIALYLRAVASGTGTATTDNMQPRRWRWYIASLAAFACGMLSKASVMTVPVVLLVVNVYPLRRLTGDSGDSGDSGDRGDTGVGGWLRSDARRVYVELLPFGIVAAAMAALSIVALKPPDQLAIGGKLAVSAYSLAFYVAKTLAPWGLAPLYEMPSQVDPFAAPYLMAYVVTTAVAAFTWSVRRRWPAATAALIVYVVMLLPTIGIVQNGPQIAADRYTYHAAPALAILAGAAFLVAATRWPIASRMAGAVLVLTLGSASWQQSTVWHDSESLWTRVLAVDSASSIAHVGLGSDLARRDRLPEAIGEYERGLRINPDYAEGHNNLGVALVRVGRMDDAVTHYQRAVALKPLHDEAYSNWGVALARQGDLARAIEHYEHALRLNLENADAHVNWGNALVRLDKPGEAIVHYRAALELRPDNADAHLNWGVALAREKNFDGAIEQFTAALALQPGLAEAREYLERAMRRGRP